MTASIPPSDLGLTQADTGFLALGLNEWGGPAYCTDEMARAMGFSGARGMQDECQTLRNRLSRHEPMSPLEWAKSLLAVEVAFVSDVMGSGYEWSTTTGRLDGESLQLLRSIQRKLVKTIAPVVGNGLGVRPPKF